MRKPSKPGHAPCARCGWTCYTPRGGAVWSLEWKAGAGPVCEMETSDAETECNVVKRVPKSAQPGSYYHLRVRFPSGRELTWQRIEDRSLAHARLAHLERVARDVARVTEARGSSAVTRALRDLACVATEDAATGWGPVDQVRTRSLALVEPVYAVGAPRPGLPFGELDVVLSLEPVAMWRVELGHLGEAVRDEARALAGAWLSADLVVWQRAARVVASLGTSSGRREPSELVLS